MTRRPPLDADAWGRLKSAFEEALHLPAEARAAFVDAQPADIRSRLAEMLAADQAPATVLERGADAVVQAAGGPPPDAGETDPRLGTRIGAYRLEEVLGRGGMGVVYRASREDFEQRVALKLVGRAGRGSDLGRRFEEERQILARLEHPNIARLLDGGVTTDGDPWFSMELVDGEPLDRFCEARALPLSARLELFATVCDTVQYAHTNLVVHRDLKPTNILVTASGAIKLLDFGIAKFLDDAHVDPGLTRTGLRPMSPGYATPEQVRGEPVTTATDVYALGVILYELVAGEGPYGRADLRGRDLEDAILTHSPRPPTRSAGRVDRDVDNIALMALRKEPTRRYGSAGALADDVRSYLAGRPVDATGDSVGYRLTKFAARNRAAVLTAAASLVLMVGSATWYTVRLRAERADAELAAARSDRVASFLQGLFVGTDPLDFDNDASAGLEMTARELLQAGVDQIGEGLAEDPAVQTSLLAVLGETYRSLGEYRLSAELLERAIEALDQLDEPDLALRAQVANGLGSAYREAGDLEEAEIWQREAFELIRSLRGPDELVTAIAGNDLAIMLWSMGRLDEAEPLMSEALDIFRTRSDPNDPALATGISNHALILRNLGRPDEAEPLYREALELKRAALGPDHPSVANTVGQLGTLLLEDQADAGGAEAMYREALRIRREALGERHPYVAISLNELAAAQRALGELDESERNYRAALALRREVLEEGHTQIAYSLVGLAELLIDLDRAAEAVPLLREGLELRQNGLPADHWLLAETRSRLGRALALVGETDEAGPLLRDAVTSLDATFGPDDRRTREAVTRLEEVAPRS